MKKITKFKIFKWSTDYLRRRPKSDREIYNELRHIWRFLRTIPTYSKTDVTREWEPLMDRFKEKNKEAIILIEKVILGLFPEGKFKKID